MTKEYIMNWDASAIVKGKGKYEVASVYTEGKHAFSTVWMALYENGVEIARDSHPGQAHHTRSINNLYSFELKSFKPGAKYEVRAEVDKIKGAKCDGIAKMRLVK